MWLNASFPLLSVWCVQVYNGFSINIIAFPSFSMLESFSLPFLPHAILYDSFLMRRCMHCPPFLFTTHCNFELAFPAFCSCFSGFPFRIPHNFSILISFCALLFYFSSLFFFYSLPSFFKSHRFI